MSEFKIRVGTELDSKKLDDFDKRVQALDGKKIKLDIDLSGAEKEIANLNKQLNRGIDKNLKTTVDVDYKINSKGASAAAKSVVGSMKQSVTPISKPFDEKDFNKLTNNIKSQVKEINSLVASPKVNDAELQAAMKRLELYKTQWDSLDKNGLSDSQLKRYSQTMSDIDAEFDKANAKLVDYNRNAANAFKKSINSGDISAEIDKVLGSFDKIKSKDETIVKMQSKLESFKNSLNDIVSLDNIDELLGKQREYNKLLDSTRSKAKMASAAQKRSDYSAKIDNDIRALENAKKAFSGKIDVWLKDNSAAASQFGDSIRDVQSRISSCNDTASLNNLKSEFNDITTQAKLADKATMSWGDRLKTQAREYAAYIGVAGAIATGAQAFRMMSKNVLEVDTAMTGLYRVTDMTADQYDVLYSKMISSAKEYGATLTDTINATSDWVRAGFDADTALGLADITAMYQHISDLDYNEASENLLTAYNGFKETFQEDFGGDAIASVEHVTDAFNELDNKFSITSAGLGEGLARSASALQMAGNTFEQSAALIGATAEVQQDPEKAGQAMKILSLRLRGMKGELEELGEEAEGVENISQMQGRILNMTNGKVNIFSESGKFRSTYEIMRDIASIYDDLSSTQQADLLETIAGKNRANDVAALIQNFSTAEKMVETALNSSGSAAAENAKYVDSLQGRLNKLQASFEALSNNTLDSGFLKGLVSAGTGALDVVNALSEQFGTIPTLLSAVSAGFSLFGKGIVTVDNNAKGLMNRFQMFGKSLSDIRGLIDVFRIGGANAAINVMSSEKINPFKDFSEQLERDKKALQEYQNLMSSPATASQAQINNALAGASDELKKYIQNVDFASRSFDDFSDKQKKQFVAMQASNKSLKSASSVIKEYNNGCKNIGMATDDFIQSVGQSNSVLGNYLSGLNGAQAGIGGYVKSLIGAKAAQAAFTVAATAANAALTMGISVAIGAAIGWISDMIHYWDDLADSVDEASNSFDQNRSSLMQNKSGYDSAVETYDKLSHGVNKAGENIALTASEYEEYQNAVNQIADMTPDMVAGFDAQGNAILKQSSNVDTLTEAYNKLITAEAKAILDKNDETGYGGLDDIVKDYNHAMENYKENADYDVGENSQLKEILESNDVDKALKELSDADIMDIAAKFEEIGFEFKGENKVEDYFDFVSDTIKSGSDKVKQTVDEISADYESNAEALNNAAKAMLDMELYGDTELSHMNDSIKNVLSQYVSGFDNAFYKKLIEDNGGDKNKLGEYLQNYISDIADKIESIDIQGQQKFADAFNAQLDFDAGNISMKEFSDKAKELDKILTDAGFTKDEKTEFMATLGFEYNDKGKLKEFTKDYEDALARFGGKDASEEVKGWLGGLNGEELEIVMDMKLDGKETVEELQEALDIAKALNGVDKINIEVETQGLESLNTALKESNSTTGLTQESIESVKARYSELEGYDPSAIFEKTTTGVRLNTRALNSLEEQYIKTKKAANDQHLGALAKEYKRLGEEIEDAKNKGKQDDVDSLTVEQTAIDEAIQEAKMLAAAYDGMTSAYKQWVDSQSAGQEGDMYNSILSGRENAQKLASENRWGNTELQDFVKMFSTEGSLDTATPQQFADAWGAAIQRSNRYFQEGTQGLDNFFSDISKKNSDLVAMNENGEWEIKPGVEVEDLAREAEVANSTVEAIVGWANEHGANFEIGVGTEDIDSLIAKSDAAKESLKNLTGEEWSTGIDINASDIDGEIEKAKAKIDEINNSDIDPQIKDEQLKAVNAELDILIQKQIEASNKDIQFMNIDRNQVQGDFLAVFDLLNQYQDAVNNASSLKLKPGVEASAIQDAEAQVQQLAEKILALPQEQRIAIGLDADDGINQVKQKIAAGEVKIPVSADTSKATTDIANVNGEDVTVDVVTQGNEAIANLKSQLEGIEDKEVKVTASASGVEQITPVKTAIDSVKSKNVSVTVTPNGLMPTMMLQAAFNALKDKVVTATANVVGTDLVNALKAAIDAVVDKTVSVSASVFGTDAVNALKDAIAGVNSKTVNITTYKTTINKTELNGTDHADGTAFARGDWGIKDSGTALMGELGPEIIVRGSQWFTVGDNGAEFVPYKKNDIVFNHKQTEELLKNGYVTSGGGRGRAYAEGTAFAGISGGWKPGGTKPSGGGNTVINNYNYNVSSGSSKSTKSSSAASKATEEAEKFEEVLDWVEVAIDRIERAIKNLDTVASSTFRSWGERTEALNKQIAEITNEIDLQQRGFDRYMKAANEVGLSADWVNKIQNGKIDVELITDENLKDKIDQYQQWYEKALDARDAIIELQEAESELYKQRFDNVEAKFDGYLGVIQHEKDMLDEFINQSEAQGWLTSQKYYEALSKNTQSNIAELEKKRAEMTAEMNAAVDSGKIVKGSEAWYEMVNAIDEVTLEIEKGKTELLEFDKIMRELDFEVFDLIQDRISNITKESDFLIDLMSNKKLYDDKGQLTDDGQATMGLHGVNYNTYMHQSDMFASEIKKLDAEIAKDPYNQDLINRRQELIELQQESILNAEREKDEIKSLVEEGIQLELDNLDKLIEKRNDALSSAKD